MRPHVIDKDLTDESYARNDKPAPSKEMKNIDICLRFCSAQRSTDRDYGCNHTEPVKEATQGHLFTSLRFATMQSVRDHLGEYQHARDGGDIVEKVGLKLLWTWHCRHLLSVMRRYFTPGGGGSESHSGSDFYGLDAGGHMFVPRCARVGVSPLRRRERVRGDAGNMRLAFVIDEIKTQAVR